MLRPRTSRSAQNGRTSKSFAQLAA